MRTHGSRNENVKCAYIYIFTGALIAPTGPYRRLPRNHVRHFREKIELSIMSHWQTRRQSGMRDACLRLGPRCYSPQLRYCGRPYERL